MGYRKVNARKECVDQFVADFRAGMRQSFGSERCPNSSGDIDKIYPAPTSHLVLGACDERQGYHPFEPHEILSIGEMEVYEERAGIMEFDAEMPSGIAEAYALNHVVDGRTGGHPCIETLVKEFGALEICGTLKPAHTVISEDSADDT